MLDSLFKRYKVDYEGGMGLYLGAKESCRAGETVSFRLPAATDERLTVLLNGAELPPDSFDDSRFEYVYKFTMPDHDVTIKSVRINTMTAPIIRNKPSEI